MNILTEHLWTLFIRQVQAALVAGVYPSYSSIQIKRYSYENSNKVIFLNRKCCHSRTVSAGAAVSSADVDGDILGVPFTGTSISFTLNESTDNNDEYSTVK
jgi:hypothetical protein